MTALSGLTTDVGALFGGTAFGGGAVGQIAQSVAIGGVGSALVASLQSPAVIAKLDPLGLLGLVHPATGVAPAATPVSSAQATALVGLNPTAKTITISWYNANPSLAPLYLAQGWTIIPG
jgi:hypothetical protein